MTKNQTYISDETLQLLDSYRGKIPKSAIFDAAVRYVVENVPVGVLMGVDPDRYTEYQQIKERMTGDELYCQRLTAQVEQGMGSIRNIGGENTCQKTT